MIKDRVELVHHDGTVERAEVDAGCDWWKQLREARTPVSLFDDVEPWHCVDSQIVTFRRVHLGVMVEESPEDLCRHCAVFERRVWHGYVIGERKNAINFITDHMQSRDWWHPVLRTPGGSMYISAVQLTEQHDILRAQQLTTGRQAIILWAPEWCEATAAPEVLADEEVDP